MPTTIRLAEYWGRSLREHSDWTQSAEDAFKLAPMAFPDDGIKVRFAAQFLRGDRRQSWFAHMRSTGNASSTWPFFVKFLKEDAWNRTLSVFMRYNRAKQQAKQSVHAFHTMLKALEAQLPEMPPFSWR